MSESNDGAGEKPAGKGKGKLLLIACVLALVAGGGGFYAVYSGLLHLPFVGGAGEHAEGEANAEAGGGDRGYEPGAFVHLDPLIVSLGAQSRSRHLKVTLAIEVDPEDEDSVTAAKPRLVDILHGYLRAVDEREFELPRSMERLRAQMLRRARLVAPDGSIRDLLIQEFLLD